MLEFQEKRKFRQVLYSKIILVCLFVVIIFLLSPVWNMYQKQSLTKENLAKTATVLGDLETRESFLLSDIERLKTIDGVEEEVRSKYGLVKPGEDVFIVIPADQAEKSNTIQQKRNFWQRIKVWFK